MVDRVALYLGPASVAPSHPWGVLPPHDKSVDEAWSPIVLFPQPQDSGPDVCLQHPGLLMPAAPPRV